MKKLSFLLLMVSGIYFSVGAQTSRIIGYVVNTNKKPVEYFHAVLLSPTDSSVLRGGAFIDGKFEFTKEKTGTYLLQLSSVGYQTYHKKLKVTDEQSIDLGTIQLESLNLKEVNVTALRPSFRMEKDKFVMRVENSSLSDLGTSIDVLRQTPMVLVDAENNLIVAGKDNTIVYVDGRKINSQQELEMINSKDIKKIEVITNPSAKYDASGQSVINIITKKSGLLNGISTIVKTEMLIGRRIQAFENITLGYKQDGLTIFGNYGYRFGKSKSFESFVREIIPTPVNRTTTDYHTTFLSDYNSHDYRLGFRYKMNEKHSLGAQLNGWYDKTTYESKTRNKYSIDKVPGITQTNIRYVPDNLQNSYNLSYDYTPDSLGQKLSVLLDVTRYSTNNNEEIEEIDNGKANSNRMNNNSDYDIYSAKVDYSLPIASQHAKLELGGKYSHISDGSSSYFSTLINGEWQVQERYINTHNYKESLSALYATIEKKINKLTINAGVRWEYINSNGNNGTTTIIDTTYSRFFPSASLNYTFSENLSLTLNYSKRISRPSYNSLNPTIIYVDKYFYRQGNPHLVPELSDVYELSSRIKNLTVNIGYQLRKKPIYFAFYQDKTNPNITMLTTENFMKKEQFYANASHKFSSRSGIFTMHNTAGIRKPKMVILDHGKSRTLSKPFYYFQQSCELLLFKQHTLYSNFLFYRPGDNDIFSYESISNFSIGIRGKLLNKKLQFNLYANDIFDSMIWKKNTSINLMTMDHKYDPDNSYLKISLTYNLGTFQPGLKSRSGNREERNRL